MAKPSRAVVLIEHNLEVVKIADWGIERTGEAAGLIKKQASLFRSFDYEGSLCDLKSIPPNSEHRHLRTTNFVGSRLSIFQS